MLYIWLLKVNYQRQKCDKNFADFQNTFWHCVSLHTEHLSSIFYMGHRSNWRVMPHYVKTQFTLKILRKNDKIDYCAFNSEWIFTQLSGDVANDNIFQIK